VRVVAQVKQRGERVFSHQGNPTTFEAAVVSAAGWLEWLADTIEESTFSAEWENGVADKLRGPSHG